MRKDYYAILGVDQDVTPEELKKVFRRLARENHPDVNPDNPEAEARFKDIAEAYEVLSDPTKRAQYERGGSFDFGDLFGGGTTLEDLLGSFFGGASPFGGRGGGQQRGRDVLAGASISLKDAAFGATVDVAFRGAVRCSTCGGSGAAEGTRPSTCGQCGGAGQVRMARKTMLGTMMTVGACDACAGMGQVVEDPCEPCHGEGRVVEDREVKVEVPGGVQDGTRLRLSGQGESAIRSGASGDLYVELRVEEDDRFDRDGDDLIHRVQVGIAEASLGAHRSVLSIDEDDVDIDIPAGTQPGTVLVHHNLGMSRLGRRGRGRMLVVVDVEVPTHLSSEQKDLLSQFAATNSEQVSSGRRRRKSR